jgi:hypothetical protein
MHRVWVAAATIPLGLMLAGPPAVAQSPPPSGPALAGTFSPSGSLTTGRGGHIAKGASEGIAEPVPVGPAQTATRYWPQGPGQHQPGGTTRPIRPCRRFRSS